MLKTKKWVPDEMWNSRFSFSQFGEDLVLASLFHRNNISQGSFVDVGAFHPIKLSNTYFFYRQGWRGVNVEPNPEGFRLFLDMRPADINLNCAVSQACKGSSLSVIQHSRGSMDQNMSSEAETLHLK